MSNATAVEKLIPIGVSGRHVHVSQEDLELVFGSGYQLTKMKDLSQPGQFASNETVDLVTTKGTFAKVRILGPVRKETQVELALTDAVKLGITPPIRDSGNLHDSPGLTLVGPNGTVVVPRGVIIACRHVHMTPVEAASYGVNDKDWVKLECDGERSMTMGKVLVRVNESFALECHIDTDEGNAASLKTGDRVRLIK